MGGTSGGRGEVGRRGERDRETNAALIPLLLQQVRLTVITQVHLWSGCASFTGSIVRLGTTILHEIWIVMRIGHQNILWESLNQPKINFTTNSELRTGCATYVYTSNTYTSYTPRAPHCAHTPGGTWREVTSLHPTALQYVDSTVHTRAQLLV